MSVQYGFTIVHQPTGTISRLPMPLAGWPKACLTLGAEASCSVVLFGRGVAPIHARFYGRGHHRYVCAADSAVIIAGAADELEPNQAMRVDGGVFLIGDYAIHHGELASSCPTDFARQGSKLVHRLPFEGSEATSRINSVAAALEIPVEDWQAFGAVRALVEALWFEDLRLEDLRRVPPTEAALASEPLTCLRPYLSSPDAQRKLAWVLEQQ
ncbi:MAG: hypothetical protein U0271_40500 [Polyangiaceae bacterium]